MTKKNRIVLISAALVVAAAIFVNIDVSIHEGVDGRYRYIHMPLYVKWTQFLARHYEYARLAREITAGYKTDEEKALAILNWTHSNIKDVPKGMPVCDDHVLYIIIRRYGVPEQFQDVFTTLCYYSGIPAYWVTMYDRSHKVKYAVSLVRIDKEWRVFDAYRGIYFRNKKGGIASVEEIMADPTLVSGRGIEDIKVRGIPYRDFYYDLNTGQPWGSFTPRAYRQMPVHRFIYEIKKALGIEKEYDAEGLS